MASFLVPGKILVQLTGSTTGTVLFEFAKFLRGLDATLEEVHTGDHQYVLTVSEGAEAAWLMRLPNYSAVVWARQLTEPAPTPDR